jgi:hypothetical protein
MPQRIFFLVLFALSSAVVEAAVPCPDQTPECRQKFVDANLPVLHKPDLSNKSDQDLFDSINETIRRAQAFAAQEQSIRDRQAAASRKLWKLS